jgi:hypothetical protein
VSASEELEAEFGRSLLKAFINEVPVAVILLTVRILPRLRHPNSQSSHDDSPHDCEMSTALQQCNRDTRGVQEAAKIAGITEEPRNKQA